MYVGGARWLQRVKLDAVVRSAPRTPTFLFVVVLLVHKCTPTLSHQSSAAGAGQATVFVFHTPGIFLVGIPGHHLMPGFEQRAPFLHLKCHADPCSSGHVQGPAPERGMVPISVGANAAAIAHIGRVLAATRFWSLARYCSSFAIYHNIQRLGYVGIQVLV